MRLYFLKINKGDIISEMVIKEFIGSLDNVSSLTGQQTKKKTDKKNTKTKENDTKKTAEKTQKN